MQRILLWWCRRRDNGSSSRRRTITRKLYLIVCDINFLPSVFFQMWVSWRLCVVAEVGYSRKQQTKNVKSIPRGGGFVLRERRRILICILLLCDYCMNVLWLCFYCNGNIFTPQGCVGEYFCSCASLGNIFAPVRRWGIFLLLCVAGEYFCSKKRSVRCWGIFLLQHRHMRLLKLFTFCTKKARTGHCVSKLRNFSLTPCDAQITCACPFLQKIPRTGKIYAQMIAKLFTFFTKKARTGYCVSKLRNFSLTPCDAPITCACPFLQKIPRTGVKYTHRWLLNFLRFLQKSTHRLLRF